jgi:hypothetical protein
VVDKHLGGPEGLAITQREPPTRGIKLLLDLVIRGDTEDARNDPAAYIRDGDRRLIVVNLSDSAVQVPWEEYEGQLGV